MYKEINEILILSSSKNSTQFYRRQTINSHVKFYKTIFKMVGQNPDKKYQKSSCIMEQSANPH